MPHDVNTLRALAAQTRVQTNGTHARATLTLPNGRTVQCTIRCDTPEALAGELDAMAGQGLAGGEDELAGFADKLKKAAKKVGKGALKPLKAVHKVTHKGVLGKMERQLQEQVGKYLPITKPFIALHKKIASPIHKALEGKKIKAAFTAKAIKDITKSIPDAAARAGAQAHLVASVKKAEALKSIAKTAVKAKVLSEAAKVLKHGPPKEKAQAKAFLKKAVQAKAVAKAHAKATGKTYKVTTPSGRTITIPASKVA
jgi:hypothetical protein